MGRLKNHNQTKERMNKIIALAALAFIGAQAADDTIAQKLNGGEREDDGDRRLSNVDGDIDVQVTRRFGISKVRAEEFAESARDLIERFQMPAKEILANLNNHPSLTCVGHSGSQFMYMPAMEDKSAF